MPINKNAVTRYKYLDEMLSDKHHYYDIHDLTEGVNRQLMEIAQEPVSQRTIEKDIKYLEYEPFDADIERIKIDSKHCIRYEQAGFSIFTKELSDNERTLLRELLSTVGQFDGIDSFDWLGDLYKRLGISEQHKIIQFSHNPYLENSDLLGQLFVAISNKETLNLSYKSFKDDLPKTYLLHPYLLKQHNDRWFLIGYEENIERIMNFALDRINTFEPSTAKFRTNDIDLEERFEEIIGVTYYDNSKIENILLWVSDVNFPYIKSKPLHGSQRIINIEQSEKLRESYPTLPDGRFVRIECRINMELKKLIGSYLGGMVALQPQSLQNELAKEFHATNKKYSNLRT